MIAVLLMGALMAKAPRFLGPPVKKPADAGVADAGHGRADPPQPGALKPGDEAPMFSGALHNPQSAGVQRVDLASMVGSEAAPEQAAKAVLISFFATWCKPCTKELPFLQQLSTAYRQRGLRVVSVAIDEDEAASPQIARLVEQNHVTYPVVKDGDNLIARQYLGEKTLLPALFIVGRNGRIALVKQGYTDDAAQFLRAEVEKALK